jgi:hypothetical protein
VLIVLLKKSGAPIVKIKVFITDGTTVALKGVAVVVIRVATSAGTAITDSNIVKVRP